MNRAPPASVGHNPATAEVLARPARTLAWLFVSVALGGGLILPLLSLAAWLCWYLPRSYGPASLTFWFSACLALPAAIIAALWALPPRPEHPLPGRFAS